MTRFPPEMTVVAGTPSAASVARRRRLAPLSPGVLGGIVFGLDLTIALAVGLVAHLVLQDELTPPYVTAILLYALLVTLGAHSAGLYRFSAVMQPARIAGRVVVVCALAFLVLVGLGFALKMSETFSRVWAFSLMVATGVLAIGMRVIVAAVLNALAQSGRIGRRIVIYGGGAHGQQLIRRINLLNEPWNQILGVFDDRISRTGPLVEGQPMLGNLADLVRWGRVNRPDEVLIALPWSAEDRLLDVLRQVAVLPANVRLSSEFMRTDMVQGRTNFQFGIPMLNAFEKPVEGWGRIFKRMFDLGLAGIAALLCLPAMLLTALAIKLESPGPVLFRQPRYGFNNRLIEVCKFRTMHVAATDLNAARVTERNDPRVTRVGSLLRRFSIDELPQLINVLRGEMSLVGPRPHAVQTTAGGRLCDDVVDQYAIRHKVKPGITGWAQVNGWRGTMVTEEQLIKRLEHDVYYINNWSPLFDLKILLMTAWTVARGRNSY